MTKRAFKELGLYKRPDPNTHYDTRHFNLTWHPPTGAHHVCRAFCQWTYVDSDNTSPVTTYRFVHVALQYDGKLIRLPRIEDMLSDTTADYSGRSPLDSVSNRQLFNATFDIWP